MMECNSQPQEDRANDDILISMVQEHEILWNSHIKHYRDRARKDAAWAMVAKGLRLTVADVKKDWIRLRTKWGREKRRSSDRTGASTSDDITTWPHFKSLCFLQTVVKARRITCYRRSRTLSTTTDSFESTETKPQIKQLVDMEGVDNKNNINNNEVWTTSINLVPFLNDMAVSQNCVVEVIHDNAQDVTRDKEGKGAGAAEEKRGEYPKMDVDNNQKGLKLRMASVGGTEEVAPSRSWHTPSPPEAEGSSGVNKRFAEDALKNCVTEMLKALKTFISQAANNQIVFPESEDVMFVQTLAAMLNKMPAEKAGKMKEKLLTICLNEDDD